jgi:hypothetical protein
MLFLSEFSKLTADYKKDYLPHPTYPHHPSRHDHRLVDGYVSRDGVDTVSWVRQVILSGEVQLVFTIVHNDIPKNGIQALIIQDRGNG